MATEAIAKSIECCRKLVPSIAIIIGEGARGAVALASSNKVIMLENSIYLLYHLKGVHLFMERS